MSMKPDRCWKCVFSTRIEINKKLFKSTDSMSREVIQIQNVNAIIQVDKLNSRYKWFKLSI